MAAGKRASMRTEGPLAALFRKTEEAGAPAVPPQREEPPAEREREYPHPSLGADAPREPAREPQVPSPKDRLRHAFSADLPDDVLAAPLPVAPPSSGAVNPFASALDEPRHVSRPGRPVIRVVGVGGAGVNAVDRMVEADVAGVEFIAINTDLQSLQGSTADITLHIGPNLTRGLGAGADPEIGRQAAMEEDDRIKGLLKGSDMVFITAGAGGGTGTGAAPVVARIARELGALTVGIVTKPFGFEGSRRAAVADDGVAGLAEEVDTLIVVPNNRLLTVLDRHTSMVDAFRVADDVLRQGVQGVSDLVTLPGIINLDFADVRTIMRDAGNALLGIGMGTGEHRAIEAAQAAVASPLLETSMDGARSILLSITGGTELSLWEVNEAAKTVAEAAHPDANIIFGAMVDEALGDQVWITVVATRLDGHAPRATPREEPRRTDRYVEPRGEVRVQRRTPARSELDLDVPEFLPRR